MKTPLIITLVVLATGAGILLYFLQPAAVTTDSPPASTLSQATPISATPGGTTVPRGVQPTFSGTRLAGTSAPLLDFIQQDFTAAQQSDKIIVLYFFANWCPICAEEFPKMQSAFNELATDQVIGFRVNFNDNETDDSEEALARQHGVAYQHTKVIVKNCTQILKSPETWPADRYLSEINQALAQ